jgi:site-specific DNA recombinase
MPSTNGHGPKRAILYARVSTDEQARSGYSLAQQLEALREYAAREGYEVLEEVSDPGQSGASLERPGMDRVRDLVAAGGVSVVLAQDRDRFTREPAYHYLLRREFEEHGTKIRALNDRGDESPEGELTDGILDQLAKYERAKTAERSRRGKLRKAREGKIIANNSVDYGFRYNDDRDGYEVDTETMAVVRRIFAMVADGLPLNAVAERLTREGIELPYSKYHGVKRWNATFIRNCIVGDDVYRPHTFDEISALVKPEVTSRLDPDKGYGIWWFNRRRSKTTQVSVPDGNGGRRYKKRVRYVLRPREEWIAVPVPDSGVPREVVDSARRTIKYNRAPSNAGRRFWELSGGLRPLRSVRPRYGFTHYCKSRTPRVLLLRLPNSLQEGCQGLPERQVLGCGQSRSLGMGGSHQAPQESRTATRRPRCHDRTGAQRCPAWRPRPRSQGVG